MFDLNVLLLKLEVSQNNFKKLVQKIYAEEMNDKPKDEVLSLLSQGKEEFMALMEEANQIPEPNDQVKDLQYQIFNSLLLANDLITFYSEDLFDRFRLRYENYKQRERVNSLLK